MAVPYHTHTFDIPTATNAEAAAGTRSDVALTPSNMQSVVDSLGILTGYPTIAAAEAAFILPLTHAIEVYGDATVGDGLGGLYIDTNNGASETFISGDGRTWYLAQDIREARLTAPLVNQIGSVYADVSTAQGATITARNKRLRTQYYATANRNGGANYRRESLANLGSTPALAYFRSNDRFMPDGSTDNTNGGYWVLDEVTTSLEMLAATGANATLDTAAFLAAAQLGRPIVLQEREYWLTPTAYPYDLNVRGLNRQKSILKWIDPTGTTSLIRNSGALRKWAFSNLTIDCNRQGHTDPASGYFSAIDLNGLNGSSLDLDAVDFLNGRIVDITMSGPTGSGQSVDLTIKYCRFIDGLLSTNATTRAAQVVSASEGVHVKAIGNYFECAFPDGVTTFGRGGIVLQRPGGSTSLSWGSYYAAGNRFKNFGRSPNVLGCLYAYSGHRSAIIIGNYAENVFGTAFQAKADGGSIIISGNTVDGQVGTAGGVIGMIGQGDTYTSTIGQNAAIIGNTIRGAEGRCIFVDGVYQAGASTFENIVISGNITNGGTRSLDLRNVNGATVTGNTFKGAGAGIFSDQPLSGTIRVANNNILSTGVGISLAGTMTNADVDIQNNTLADLTGAAISLGVAVKRFEIQTNIIDGCTTAFVTNGAAEHSIIVDNNGNGTTGAWTKNGTYSGGAWYARNRLPSSSVTVRTLTIAAGVVEIFGEWHYIDTEGLAATDDLDTINGGREGDVISIRAADSNRTVVMKDSTGNLQLNSDFALDNAQDSINLQKIGNTWYEISRINLAA